LPLCLTKHHALKTYWGSGGIAPCILDPQENCKEKNNCFQETVPERVGYRMLRKCARKIYLLNSEPEITLLLHKNKKTDELIILVTGCMKYISKKISL
jgi:hypothetical protein